MSHSSHKSQSKAALTNQFLALSLFIVLLAFFIVLNAISVRKEESEYVPVLASIDKAFSSGSKVNDDITATAVRPSLNNTPQENDQSDGEQSALDELDALFQAQIPGMESDYFQQDGVYKISVKYSVLDYAITHLDGTVSNPYRSKKEGFDHFFGGIVYLMINNPKFQQYHLDIYLNTPFEPSLVDAQQQKFATKQIETLSKMAKNLEAAGLDRRYINIGLQKGRPHKADIYFTKYEDYSPVQDKTQQEEN